MGPGQRRASPCGQAVVGREEGEGGGGKGERGMRENTITCRRESEGDNAYHTTHTQELSINLNLVFIHPFG